MNKEEIEKEFVVFRRPSCCIQDFLAQDCDGNYYRLQEVDPKQIKKIFNNKII